MREDVIFYLSLPPSIIIISKHYGGPLILSACGKKIALEKLLVPAKKI
jgi:hypothetical protein